MTRDDAIALLAALPECGGSLSPCEQANPKLWAIWSQAKGRLSGATVWTELDVAESARLMLQRHINAAVSPRDNIPSKEKTI